MSEQDEAAEAAAVRAVERLTEEIFTVCAPIAHWGGEEPYDGVLSTIRERLLALTNYEPAPVSSKRDHRFTAAESLTVFAKSDYRCVTCGTRDALTVDHIVPQSRGGSHEMTNLQALCVSCNSRKGNRL